MKILQIRLARYKGTARNVVEWPADSLGTYASPMEAKVNDQSWQLRVLETLFKEGEANERLKREDPEAFEAKRLASLPWTRCAMCSVNFKGYGNNARPILNGKVCDECNTQVVMQRIREHKRHCSDE